MIVLMGGVALLLLLIQASLPAGGIRHFELAASFEPAARVGANAQVVVHFRALDPDLRLNEEPAPRLNLDLLHDVLLDKQPPSSGEAPAYDPLTARYLDLDKPVRFPVALSPTAPSGRQSVPATVVFFYCSVREAWCRRGSVDVLIPVTVR
jgi:hypothetical protein